MRTDPLPQIGSSDMSVTGRVTHVRDGDTIEIGQRPIRFSNLDYPELGTVDGDRATRRMKALVRHARLTCDLTGRQSYDRFIGSCRLSDGRDLSQIMIESGTCQRSR